MEPSINPSLETANIDISKWKIAVVWAAGLISALAFGYFLRLFLGGGNQLMVLTAALVLFLIVFVLQTLFLKGGKIVYSLAALESGGLMIFFLDYFSWYWLAALAALLGFFWLAVYRGRAEIDDQMKVHFPRIEKKVLAQVFTGISLLISLMYVEIAGLGNLGITQKQIDNLLRPAEPIVQNLLIGNFSFNMTVYQFVEASMVNQLAGQLGVPINAVPAAAKSAAINQSLNALQGQAAGYGINFRNSDTISQVVYNYLVGQIKKIPSGFRFAVPAGVALIVFLTVRGLGTIIRWLVSVPAYLVYELLLLTGFARLSLESRSREIIIL
ncbi:MAG: hypothetical protein HYY86_03010 [Candidatus Harrisonbacteria bacterium]|nr:hypothetical protein [Candidatus Harrisonbacteria bacterium]